MNHPVRVLVVDGIVKMQTITKVPHAPSFGAAPWVRGITSLRGEMLSVIDLRLYAAIDVHRTHMFEP